METHHFSTERWVSTSFLPTLPLDFDNIQIFFNWPHLKIYIPEPDYLLAMKTLASRVDTRDKEDIQFLINKMGITTAEEIFKILEKYYPKEQIKPVTQFFIEELFAK